MHGLSRTPNTFDLNLIFFKIRETRDPKTRRSWQRRARLALAQRDDLTPTERHEISAVWSQHNAHQIDSPAMSKLLGKPHQPQPHQTISAKSCTRRPLGTGVKKPSVRGLVAANDDVFNADCSVSRSSPALETAPQHRAICKPRYALFQPASILFQGCTYHRFDHDNGVQALLSDSRLNQRRRRGRKPESCKVPIKTRLSKIICRSIGQPLIKVTKFSARNELQI
jgi:hypothetical protein